MPAAAATLPTLADQAETLIALGLPELVGLPVDRLREMCRVRPAEPALLAVHPDLAPPSALAPLLRRDDKPGFVVSDMVDVDDFGPIPSVAPPDTPFYLVCAPDRGDAMANWSPEEALPAIVAAGRTPLSLTEGLHWVLQQPDVLQRNRCFMTIGSRLRKPNGSLDARTPALWISNGTGRDGAAHRNAPKLGWCWAGNRHTWLGFASAARRDRIATPG